MHLAEVEDKFISRILHTCLPPEQSTFDLVCANDSQSWDLESAEEMFGAIDFFADAHSKRRGFQIHRSLSNHEICIDCADRGADGSAEMCVLGRDSA